jgi:GNAT superfamily N-acetyltransferase
VSNSDGKPHADWSIIDLAGHPRGTAKAATLFGKQIEHVVQSKVCVPDHHRRRELEERVKQARRDYPDFAWHVPDDAWLGVEDAGGTLVGAVHLAVPVGQTMQVFERLGTPEGAGPRWLCNYLLRCAFIDEVAVRPEHRRRGMALALLDAAEKHALADECRDLRSIVAYAGSAAAIALFQRAGYDAAEAGEPVPREFANGLPTYFDPRYQNRPGAYVYKHTEKYPGDWRL